MSKALVEVQGMSYGEYLGMLRNILEDPPQAGPLIAGVTNIFSALVVFYFAYTAFSGLLSVALYAIGLWFLLAVVKWVLGCE